MKIIISPSKTQSDKLRNGSKTPTYHYPEKTDHIFSYMQSLSKTKLGLLLKIKGKLLDQVYDKYRNKEIAYPAIDLYTGVVFEQIKKDEMNSRNRRYLQQHLIILSAMYGPLATDTLIYPYRLDMTIKPKQLNLYQYWRKEVDEFFAREDVIINLASNEFSNMIYNQRHKMIHIHFQEQISNGTYKVVSYNAKKARGLMVNQMIHQNIVTPCQLKKLHIDQYIYNDDLSDEQNYYFIKHQ